MILVKIDNNPTRPALKRSIPCGDTLLDFPDSYVTEKWRIIGATGCLDLQLANSDRGQQGLCWRKFNSFHGYRRAVRHARQRGDRTQTGDCKAILHSYQSANGISGRAACYSRSKP